MRLLRGLVAALISRLRPIRHLKLAAECQHDSESSARFMFESARAESSPNLINERLYWRLAVRIDEDDRVLLSFDDSHLPSRRQ